jgi:hypothetical protein
VTELIRPLETRIADARMTLASLPFPPDPLRFCLERDRGEPPDVPVEVREQVIREALSDALTYHCSHTCPHIVKGEPFAVFAMSKVVCPSCV